MLENTKKRFYSIDILKMICSFLVVCIHAPLPGEFGKYVISLARVAVPIFLMVTGFFCTKGIKKQIKKITMLLLFSNGLYFIFNIFKYTLNHNIGLYVKELFSIDTLAKFIFLNDSPFGIHLWYLGAILYVLIIYYLLNKVVSTNCAKKIFYVLTPFLLICDLILGKYSILLFNKEFPYIIVRNFIFVGIPYFSIGMFIRDNQEKLRKISNKKWFILMIIFILLNLLERFILVKYRINATRDHYLNTTFLSFSLFMFFANSNFIIRKYNDIIGKLSTFIYIIHPMVAYFCAIFFKHFLHSNLYLYFYPILVFITSTFIFYIISICRKYIKVKYSGSD